MPVTVGQILQLPVLKDARLLAGEEGLDRRVTSVTVGEVPDIADWLSGGEMVLSTMFAVKGDLERQREFCRRVMMAGAAALFVKTTRFVENVPADIIELADKRKFPIVEVPQSLRWTRLMQDATEVIINRQASQLERSQAIHRSLLGVVIRGGGWQDLAEEASRLLEGPVFVVDVSLEVLAASSGLAAAGAGARGTPAAARDPVAVRVTRRWAKSCSGWTRKGCRRCSRCPSWPATSVWAISVRLHRGRRPSAMELLVLEHSATIAALRDGSGPGAVRDRGTAEGRLRGRRHQRRRSGRATRFCGAEPSWGAT